MFKRILEILTIVGAVIIGVVLPTILPIWNKGILFFTQDTLNWVNFGWLVGALVVWAFVAQIVGWLLTKIKR
jgi:hypothetical protein